MRLDSSLSFVPLGAPLSLIGAAGVAINSGIIDLLGVGVGNAPPSIIGNVALFGEDVGVGDGFLIPKLIVSIGTALVTGTAATLVVALQMAPDTATTYQPGTWQTLIASPAITAAQGTTGAIVAGFDWPPVFPSTLRPRYARLSFIVPAATDFTAGTIAFATVTSVRDLFSNKQAANNYVVA